MCFSIISYFHCNTMLLHKFVWHQLSQGTKQGELLLLCIMNTRLDFYCSLINALALQPSVFSFVLKPWCILVIDFVMISAFAQGWLVRGAAPDGSLSVSSFSQFDDILLTSSLSRWDDYMWVWERHLTRFAPSGSVLFDYSKHQSWGCVCTH